MEGAAASPVCGVDDDEPLHALIPSVAAATIAAARARVRVVHTPISSSLDPGASVAGLDGRDQRH
jgi:hypothetical protein